MPHLARITIYPVKSLDGLDLAEARVLPSGALEHDRRYAIVDADGRFVNGKRTPRVHAIRSRFDPASGMLTLDGRAFDLDETTARHGAEARLSEALGMAIRLVEDRESGFPDDDEAPGPTVVAAATLDAVAGWFPGLDADETRRRFRANLEIAGVEPFWDDRLHGPPGSVVRFLVGPVAFEGTNPCRRCVVPTRDATDGAITPGFARAFSAARLANLPSWADAGRFDNPYRLAANTRPAGPGGTIRINDPVTLLETVPA